MIHAHSIGREPAAILDADLDALVRCNARSRISPRPAAVKASGRYMTSPPGSGESAVSM
jgi:hypothetical protein